MAWRKTFLDDPIKALGVNAGIDWRDPVSISSIGLTSTGEITGADEAAAAAAAGAEKAAAATIESTEKNIEFQKWLWSEQKALTQPFVAAGERGLAGYEQAIGKPFTAADMERDPGYQFRLSEGMKGIETSAAARGMQLSGRTLKGIGRYAQDYASQEFQNAYSRRQQGISNLYNLATMGQASAAGQAVQGGVMGGNISQSILQGGQAQSQLYSDLGNIQAAQAQAPWNALMGVAGLGAMYYGAGGGGGA